MPHQVIRGLRRVVRPLSAIAAAAALSACDPTALTGGPGAGGSDTVQVALLVPAGAGDGNVAFLAQNLTNAARLAAADLDGAQVDLRVYDTAGNAAQAARVTSQAIGEGADVIVGPLFAEAAAAAGVAAAGSGVTVLSFSNNPGIAGGNVFVMGPTFDNTARRLLGYARRQGVSSIMIVNGNAADEVVGRDAIARAAQSVGVSVAATRSFDMSQQGIDAAVPGIVSSARASGVDALFLTSNTDTALPFLTNALNGSGLPPSDMQYIGLTRWDVPASALSLPGLQGGWFALPDTRAMSAFATRYAGAYGSAPHSIAGLGYDGIAAVGALAKAGRAQTPGNFTQSRGFAGASGAFRFLQDGSNQRALSVATIRNQQVQVVDAAPTRFGGAGL